MGTIHRREPAHRLDSRAIRCARWRESHGEKSSRCYAARRQPSQRIYVILVILGARKLLLLSLTADMSTGLRIHGRERRGQLRRSIERKDGRRVGNVNILRSGTPMDQEGFSGSQEQFFRFQGIPKCHHTLSSTPSSTLSKLSSKLVQIQVTCKAKAPKS